MEQFWDYLKRNQPERYYELLYSALEQVQKELGK